MPLAKEDNVLVPAMGELIIGLIAFALLAFVLMRYVWPRMEQIYRERRDAIEGGIARAEAAQAEAQRTLEQYQAQLAEARNEAAQIREGARAESARIVARGDEQLRTQRSQVVRELRGEIGTIAVELSERIIGQRLADDAQVSSTVDSFLAELEQQDQASANGN